MKRVVILIILIIFVTSCVPSPEELAGVTREELATGRAVEKVLKINKQETQSIEGPMPTLADAHEKEIVDVAENTWQDIREEGAPRVLESGAIEMGVGQKATINVE
jgi:hypothetical protein